MNSAGSGAIAARPDTADRGIAIAATIPGRSRRHHSDPQATSPSAMSSAAIAGECWSHVELSTYTPDASATAKIARSTTQSRTVRRPSPGSSSPPDSRIRCQRATPIASSLGAHTPTLSLIVRPSSTVPETVANWLA